MIESRDHKNLTLLKIEENTSILKIKALSLIFDEFWFQEKSPRNKSVSSSEKTLVKTKC